MAKRKRLTPPQIGDAPEMSPEMAAVIPGAAPETKSMFPAYRDGWEGVRPSPAPIAAVAGEAATAAALDELADTLARARTEGRMILTLPLDQIDAGYLIRDRIAVDQTEMTALCDSLRRRGQQSPIEVTDLGAGRYGLISGWRRLEALKALRRETSGAQFTTVLALLRRPADAADAYLAMVEENEIRVGLSYYERARIVARTVGQGAYDSHKKALQSLFHAASRSKRSKIGSYLPIVEALDGALAFPEALNERAGLALSKALLDQPALGPQLRDRLLATPATDAAAELVAIMAAIRPQSKAGDTAGKGRHKPDAGGTDSVTASPDLILPDLTLTDNPDGSLTLRGAGVTQGLRADLRAWLAGRG